MDELRAAGLRWHPDSGQASLTGPLLALAADCDRAFGLLAAEFHAVEEQHPVLISAQTLHRLDYFTSFPQQASWPVGLADDEANLAAFSTGEILRDGEMRLTRTAPIRAVLTPAACYHLYAGHQGEDLPGPSYLTLRASCFRRERYYTPLARQASFTMREIVCLGTGAEVRAFLARGRDLAAALALALDLTTGWQPATDPFFQPLSNPRYLLQKIAPTKEELVCDDLAIASINLHHDHMGVAFDLTRRGEVAQTGCLAFGLERWLHTLVGRYGSDPAAWPSVAAAAEKVLA